MLAFLRPLEGLAVPLAAGSHVDLHFRVPDDQSFGPISILMSFKGSGTCFAQFMKAADPYGPRWNGRVEAVPLTGEMQLEAREDAGMTPEEALEVFETATSFSWDGGGQAFHVFRPGETITLRVRSTRYPVTICLELTGVAYPGTAYPRKEAL